MRVISESTKKFDGYKKGEWPCDLDAKLLHYMQGSRFVEHSAYTLTDVESFLTDEELDLFLQVAPDLSKMYGMLNEAYFSAYDVARFLQALRRGQHQLLDEVF